MDYIKKYAKWIGLVGGALIVLAVIAFPFIKASAFGNTETRTFISGDLDKVTSIWQDIPVLILGALAAVAIYFNKGKFAACAAVLAAILTVWAGISYMNEIPSGWSQYYHYGYGYFVILLGAAAVCVAVYGDMKNTNKTFKEYFDFKSEMSTVKSKMNSNSTPAQAPVAPVAPAAPAAPVAPVAPAAPVDNTNNTNQQ